MLIDLAPLLLAAAFGISALLLIGFGVTQYLALGDRMSRRLMGAPAAASSAEQQQSLIIDDSALRSLERFLTPTDEERASKIRKKLDLAGYRNPAAVRIYFAAKWGVALGGFMLGALLFAAIMDPAKPLMAIAAVLMVVTFSFFATDMYIERRIAYRRIDIERSFPDALDLMLVCIEAGNGLDQAISRVATEISRSGKTLAEELSIVVAQLRAGKERPRVLADFAERTNVEDVAAFVTVIKQADKYGVSIADTLRVYASEMRNKRFMRAEEKANMMPVKLAIGAIIFTIPPTIIVLVGPAMITIVREMLKATSGAAL